MNRLIGYAETSLQMSIMHGVGLVLDVMAFPWKRPSYYLLQAIAVNVASLW